MSKLSKQKLALAKLRRELEESWRRGVSSSRRTGTLAGISRRLDRETVYRNVTNLVYMPREQFEEYYPGALFLALEMGEDGFYGFVHNVLGYLVWFHAEHVGAENTRKTTKKEAKHIEDRRIQNITRVTQTSGAGAAGEAGYLKGGAKWATG